MAQSERSRCLRKRVQSIIKESLLRHPVTDCLEDLVKDWQFLLCSFVCGLAMTVFADRVVTMKTLCLNNSSGQPRLFHDMLEPHRPVTVLQDRSNRSRRLRNSNHLVTSISDTTILQPTLLASPANCSCDFKRADVHPPPAVPRVLVSPLGLNSP